MNEAVGKRPKYQHTARQHGKILLVFEIAVHRQERVTAPRRSAQKLAVRNAGPAKTSDCVRLVTGQIRGEIHRKILVK